MTDKQPVFQVKANGFEFQFDQAAIESVDLVQKSPTLYNIIKDNRSVNVQLLEADVRGKILRLEVEGETFDVEIKDELDLMLDQMGFNAVSTKRIREIKAPMPGLVIDVAVTEGQQVKEGDRILILEAMKMENSILIHADATIKRVAVKAGQAVDKGQVLVELE
ncbi:MAG TPA: biotin/lipoyl-binding protein [Lacibacter sp.]|nr:biotin/lipoyl-binding protein [Lacibacter sp.]HMO89350.1 biotin/lipoyl-binding protein [Lacibacter sp.]HMP88013.1 biotin/lipoyl-binding protein [Lacibacter sp.]